MPVEFLTDEQASAYGRFVGSPSRAELERCFLLDDVDRSLVMRHRGEANRLGFALQVGVVRLLGTFLTDLNAVPVVAVEYVAEDLGVTDRSCLQGYAAREKTRLEHEWEITRVYGFKEFASVEAELTRWIDDRAWTTGEGPAALFDGAVAWLRERLVLLPGVSVLARLVARVRDEVVQRLWDVLAGMLTARKARMLKALLEVPVGARRSNLERLRKGITTVSGKGMVAALDRVAEVAGLGLGAVALDGVPQRRIVELARWGMAGKAPALRRHPASRKLATLLALPVVAAARLGGMTTLVLGSPPPELEALLERRRRAGVDRLDEVWQGVRHMVPGPSSEHARISQQLAEMLGPPARAAGLLPAMGEFNLGESEYDFRVPDGGLLHPGAAGVWLSTAAVVVEILSPGDESWQKLPFYAEYHVDEVLFVDPAERTITWLALRDGEYKPVERSGLIGLGPAELAEQLDWP